MIALIDTIFHPLLMMITNASTYLNQASVPLSRPLNISNYLGPFVLLGPYWMLFITNSALLAFIYVVLFIVQANNGLVIKFKGVIKWW